MFNEPDQAAAIPVDPSFAGGSNSTARSKEEIWFLSGRLSPAEDVRHVPVLCSPFRIGREFGASIRLADQSVSELHAELAMIPDSLVLRDLGSASGTYVNARRISGPTHLRPDDLVQFGALPFRVLKQTALPSFPAAAEDVVDQAMVLVEFEKMMKEQAVVPHFQPIVDLPNDQIRGFEVLARTRVAGLESATAMFSVAAQLRLQTQLSRMMRSKAIQLTSSFERPPHLFLNTHPSELHEPGLPELIETLRSREPAAADHAGDSREGGDRRCRLERDVRSRFAR